MDDLDNLIWSSTGVKPPPVQQQPASLNSLRATTPLSTAIPSLSTTTSSLSSTTLPTTSFGNNTIARSPSPNTINTTNTNSASRTKNQNNLGSLGNILGNVRTPPQRTQTLNELKTQTSPQPKPVNADEWDLDLLPGLSPNPTTNISPALSASPSANLLLDLEFDDLPKPVHTPNSQPTRQQVVKPQAVDDDFDLLPGLSSTSTTHKTGKTPPPKPARSTARENKSRSVEKSSKEPNDHLIAQIVDMGFTVTEAQNALAATATGVDVSSAVEILVQQREAEAALGRENTKESSKYSQRKEFSTDYDSEDDPVLGPRPDRLKNRNLHMTKSRSLGKNSSDGEGSDLSSSSSMSSFSNANFQQQKEKLLSTASEIGFNAFRRASNFYRTSKEKVNKAIGEFQQQQQQEADEGNRKPKWLKDNAMRRDSDGRDDENYSAFGSFRDSDDDDSSEDETPGSRRYKPARENSKFKDSSDDEILSGRRGKPVRQPSVQSKRTLQPKPTKPTKPSSLSSDKTYVSPARHRTPQTTSSTLKVPSQSSTRSRSPSSALSNKPKYPPRPVVHATSEQLKTCERHRNQGNELFRLGQFGAAEQSYSRAIDSLPSNHLHVVISYNNRAASRLKNGDHRGCVEDCNRVMQLIGNDYDNPPPPGVDINLKEHYAKALLRRATSYEAMEKYTDARDDYEKLLKSDMTNSKTINDGLRRCQKAIKMFSGDIDNVGKPPSSSGSSLSRSQLPNSSQAALTDLFAPVNTSNTFGTELNAFGFVETGNPFSTMTSSSSNVAIDDSSPAVQKLRHQRQQEEREDAEKFRVMDIVDSKLVMWKAGKEDNLRALLGSIDIVLWEGLEWKKIGLQELVTPAQVKVRYMKAIAKVHPDKLSSSTTVEQRLIANGVFATLNEAWDTFKEQNNL